MLENKQCIVIFPIYKPLEAKEQCFLEQAVAMTPGFDKIFVAPEGLNIKDTLEGELSSVSFQFFDKSYFESVAGYNYLMLSEEFYERFSEYEYILIHQTDAYIFRPDLAFWCNMGYSYIGAPWLRPQKIRKGQFYQFLIKYFRFMYPSGKRKLHACYNAVGNGGFSLRKVADCLLILRNLKARKTLKEYKEKLMSDSFFNEDVFWSIEGPRLLKNFRKPSWQEATLFSLENWCEFSVKKNNNQLPFGCHALYVYEPDYWRKYIPNL